MQRAHILFSGTVQGVGFRFTVQRYALRLGLKGWVRNLPNGQVEVLVDGPKTTIEELCRYVEHDFEGHIRDRNLECVSSDEPFKEFRIVH